MSSENATQKYNKPELIKNKYYRAEDADYIFEYLESENDRIQEENQKLRKIILEIKNRREELKKEKADISDTIMSSKTIARQIISDANSIADKKISDAERRADIIVRNAIKEAKTIKLEAVESAESNYKKNTQEVAIMRAAESFARIKEQQLKIVDNINQEWQKLLLDYYGEGSEGKSAFDEINIPLDLSEKIDAIANQLKLIEFDEDYDD